MLPVVSHIQQVHVFAVLLREGFLNRPTRSSMDTSLAREPSFFHNHYIDVGPSSAW